MDTIVSPESRPSETAISVAAPITEVKPPFRGMLRYGLRVLVFLGLIGALVALLVEPMRVAFLANPGLNGIILGVLAVGILLALAALIGLARAVRTANAAVAADDDRRMSRHAVLFPLAAPMVSARSGGIAGEQASAALESISVRLDDGRETLRYLAGLLVFLGLLGTFWGLLETVSSVGGVIKSLRSGSEAGAMFDELKSGLSAPLSGMGLAFSSSLFGVAGSLVLGFLDLQLALAQRQIRHDAEGWLARLPSRHAILSGVSGSGDRDQMLGRLEQLLLAQQAGAGPDPSAKATTQAMANLAEGIQGLVQHMRTEQQLIRDWVEAQAGREREIKLLLERLAGEREPRA